MTSVGWVSSYLAVAVAIEEGAGLAEGQVPPHHRLVQLPHNIRLPSGLRRVLHHHVPLEEGHVVDGAVGAEGDEAGLVGGERGGGEPEHGDHGVSPLLRGDDAAPPAVDALKVGEQVLEHSAAPV